MTIQHIIKFLLVTILFSSCAQQKHIYIFENRYKHDIQKLNQKSSYNLRPIKILQQYMIDPKRIGEIDYDLVDKYLDKLYPKKNVRGILCINLEGELFKHLRDADVSSKKFKYAEREYIKLIQFVKEKIPNIKIGIYGLPFKGYYESQLAKNTDNRLIKVLKAQDVFMPSLYIAYPAAQKNVESNINYLKENLDIIFKYATQLNKKVYPFFWYLVHPTNRKYGYAFIPKEELKQYIEYLYNYSYHSHNIKGIIWWDTPTPFKNNTINKTLIKNKKIQMNNLDQAFKYYILKK